MGNFTGPVQSITGFTSDVFTTPYPVQLGSRMRDSNGYEYVLCDSTSTNFSGQPVQINSDWTLTQVGVSGRGPVGVCVAGSTSDNAQWVQIYGKCMMQIIHSGVSASDAANGPTTLQTSAATQFWIPTSVTSPASLRWTTGNTSISSGMIVRGLSVAQDAAPASVSDQTSSPSHTGSQISVWLNFPYIVQINFGE